MSEIVHISKWQNFLQFYVLNTITFVFCIVLWVGTYLSSTGLHDHCKRVKFILFTKASRKKLSENIVLYTPRSLESNQLESFLIQRPN